MEKIIAVILLILVSPLLLFLFILVRFSSRGNFIYKQKRWGKDKTPFYIYKIRTMIEGADKLKKKYKHLNEADGPVFKIQNDPRFTPIGRHISHWGLDEIPQLINIIKGEMSFVGPRPFPVDEAQKVPKKYEARFSVLPGITSTWVVAGASHKSFKKWMEMDVEYISKVKKINKIRLIFDTLRLIVGV